MAENVKTFALCSNHRKLLAHMDAMQKAALLDALFAYNDGEDTHPDDPLVDTVFMVMVESIERMRKFSEQKKLNGMNGGRPKTKDNQNKPNKTKENQDKPNQTPISESESIKEENTNVFLSKSPDFDEQDDQLLNDAPAITQGELVPSSQKIECPQQKILSLYREILPSLPDVRTLRPNLQSQVRARWNEKCHEKGFSSQEEGLEYFRKFFTYVSNNDFLSGRKNTGQRKWRCSYAWLMKAENFDKVTSGYYSEGDVA